MVLRLGVFRVPGSSLVARFRVFRVSGLGGFWVFGRWKRFVLVLGFRDSGFRVSVTAFVFTAVAVKPGSNYALFHSPNLSGRFCEAPHTYHRVLKVPFRSQHPKPLTHNPQHHHTLNP